jgi:uncharacterized protein (TIGR02466 family)
MSDDTFNYNYLFPSLVVYKDFGKVPDDLIDLSRDIISEHGGKPFNSPCLSTVRTYANVLNLKEFTKIKEQIIQTIAVFCDIHKIEKEELYFVDSWLNSYQVHGFQDLHLHPDSLLSGVFYIKSSGEKDFVFQSPYHFYQPITPKYTETNLNNCHTSDYNSLEGRCIIFMSNLMHRTLPATDERISLSFNIKYKNV